MRLNVHWTLLEATPDCLFLSGPAEVNPEDILGNAAFVQREQHILRLTFGSAPFQGDIKGNRFEVARLLQGRYGSPQRAREQIVGQLEETGLLQGRYGYEGSGRGSDPEIFECSIDAKISGQP